MNRTEISNVGRINQSYSSAEERLQEVVRKLRSECDKHISENIYYRSNGRRSIFATVLLGAASLAVLFFGHLLSLEAINNMILHSSSLIKLFDLINVLEVLLAKPNILLNLRRMLLVAAFLYCVYRTGIKIYCKSLANYAKRIDKVEQEILSKLPGINAMRQVFFDAAAGNRECTIGTDNKVGEEIARIRSGFTGTNQRAQHFKKCIAFGASALWFIAFIAYILIDVKKNDAVTGSGLSNAILCVAAAATVNLTMFCVGEYIGGFAKVLGVVMAVIYGVFLSSAIKEELLFPAVDLPVSGFAGAFNVAYIAIPAIQVIGIVLTVLLSRYNLEKERWENAATRSTLFWRGGIALILALYICLLFMREWDLKRALTICVLWHVSNHVVRPLEAFWGKGRTIANEIVLAAMILTAHICRMGTILMEGDELEAWSVILLLTVGITCCMKIIGLFFRLIGLVMNR